MGFPLCAGFPLLSFMLTMRSFPVSCSCAPMRLDSRRIRLGSCGRDLESWAGICRRWFKSCVAMTLHDVVASASAGG
eukprot:3543971-Pyramimonas_sp.AAC.1